MTQPTRFVPTVDFSDEETNGVAGRSTLRTAMLDALMSALKTTTDGICDSIALIQRDDGEILDGMVKLHTLSSAVLLLLGSSGFTIPATGVAWGTARAYVVKDLVTNGTGTYVCAVAHTSGVFATDLAAAKWAKIFDTVTYTAAQVSFSPTGTIAAANVQSAIAEVASEAAQKDSSVQVVDTIAVLKALSAPSSAVTYLVRGYAAVQDGGGGFYWWDAASGTADDGGTVIQLNAGGAGRFKKLF